MKDDDILDFHRERADKLWLSVVDEVDADVREIYENSATHKSAFLCGFILGIQHEQQAQALSRELKKMAMPKTKGESCTTQQPHDAPKLSKLTPRGKLRQPD